MDRTALDASAALAETSGANRSRLDRIADLLRCPVETFTDGATTDDAAFEASDLLRLWLTIADADDRRKVLTLARQLAQS